MNLRRATVEDAEPIAEILAAIAPEGLIATQPPVDIPKRAERLRAALAADAPSVSFVLEHKGRVVGSATAHQAGPPGVLYLGMGILPEARGQGGGRMLLDAVLAHGHDSTAHKIDLEVWTDNVRAVALYASSGFSIEGVRHDHYRRRDGSLKSALLMAKRLDHR